MKRREFITLLGATASWPPVARAPQPARMRRLGLLLGFAESDPLAQSWNTAFVQRLRELGWTEGRNIRFDYRWTVGGIAANFAPAQGRLI
jgi:putative ABC transport system substrate-binding protein